MSNFGSSGLKLGVNVFGRIGKLTVWHPVARKYFDEVVVNIGRQAESSLEDIAHCVERDSAPQEQCKVVRLGEYKFTKVVISISLTAGLKIKVERQPSVKEIYNKG